MPQPNLEHHKIDYIEFSVTNMEEAQSFYQSLFGWTFTDYSPGYAGIKNGDSEMGGFCLAETVTTGGPLVVLYSENLEASFAKAKQMGATITQEIFSFPGGRRFQLKDPSGNELGVWCQD